MCNLKGHYFRSDLESPSVGQLLVNHNTVVNLKRNYFGSGLESSTIREPVFKKKYKIARMNQQKEV